MEVIETCNKALASVKDCLSISQHKECYDLINKHNECVLGLEFAIDFLTEDEAVVSNQVFELFHLAFTKIGQPNNDRLPDLQGQVKQ